MTEYLSIDQLIERIEEPNRSRCQRLLEDNRELFERSKGSKRKHQWWERGYLDHLEECGNIALQLYTTLGALRELPFTPSDALLVLFLHDLEKPWKYAAGETIENPDAFKRAKIDGYGIELSDEHENALTYIHGEGDDYDPNFNVADPLAAFCHMCDYWSARGWYDEPAIRGMW